MSFNPTIHVQPVGNQLRRVCFTFDTEEETQRFFARMKKLYGRDMAEPPDNDKLESTQTVYPDEDGVRDRQGSPPEA